MRVEGAPSVFLSYAHNDKRAARRVVQRLTAHGIRVRLDERELRLGSALTQSIRTAIERTDALLVVASESSAMSDWVALELECARGV